MAFAYDALVDGVLRKSNSCVGKAVAVQKNKKLDCGTFLFRTDDGVLDSDLLVAPTPSALSLKEGNPSTIGIIELRVSVLRRFDEKHALVDVPTYLSCKDEGQERLDEPFTFTETKPILTMTFDKECVALDNVKANRGKKKVLAARPGLAPWAIFRFHYRTKGM